MGLANHVSDIHCDSNTWITVAYRKNRFTQYHYEGVENATNRLIELSRENVDVYMSNADFFAPKRGLATLYRINSLFIDIDCHEHEFDLGQTLYYLNTEFFEKTVPRPSRIIATGRGLQLHYFIENAPRMALPLWQLLQDRLIKEFESISSYVEGVSVDNKCRDVTRIARLPESYNTKSKTRAYIVDDYAYRYRLDEIVEGYYTDLQFDREKAKAKKELKAKKTTKKKQNKVTNLYTKYSLLCARMNDLTKLIELRGGDCNGYRDEMLFIFGWTVISKNMTEQQVVNEILAINVLFKEPLPDRVAREKAKYIYKKFKSQVLKKANPKQKYEYHDRYLFKNDTIIKRLNITRAEMKLLTTIIDEREKYDRNNERRRKLRRDNDGLLADEKRVLTVEDQIIEMKNNKVKNKDIAESLRISIKTVEKYVTKLRKSGRL